MHTNTKELIVCTCMDAFIFSHGGGGGGGGVLSHSSFCIHIETSKERPQWGWGPLVFVERVVSSRRFALSIRG